MARPIAVSAAATVSTKSEKTAGEVAEIGREGDQVDIDGKQNELDRHQNDDDVLAIENDAATPA